MNGASILTRSVEPAADGGLLEVPAPIRSEVSRLAGETGLLLREGRADEAREAFAQLVTLEQRRACRLAYFYLRNTADADDAVQDAFVRAYVNIGKYRPDLPFEVWFTRILVNGCLDRRKSHLRRLRWMLPSNDWDDDRGGNSEPFSSGGSPEDEVLRLERARTVSAAVDRLPERQKTVLYLCHHEGRTAREVGAITGLSEATVRVHLHRALRRLRTILEANRESRCA